MLTNTPDRFGVLSRLLHGLMALMLLGLIVLGLFMTDLDKQDPLRPQIYNLHKAIGVLALLLAVLRILWLRLSKGPELPGVLAGWEKLLSRIVVGLLYLLMLAVPMAGYLMSNSAGYPVSFFGLFDLPTLIGKNEAVHEITETAHTLFSYGLLGLVGLHVVGALKHRYWDRAPEADVLKRMF